jgi:hypothetical protein
MTRIRYLLPLGLMWACGVDDPSDSDEPIEVPSFRSTSALPGGAPGTNPIDLPASCLTRYDFSDRSVADVECRRTTVDGDPDHFVVTCPAHPQLPTTVEVERADDGRLLRDKVVFTAAGHGNPLQVRTYQYDAALQLAAIEQDTNGDGLPNWRRAVLERDGDGQPLSEEIRTDPWELPDGVYAVTAHQAVTTRYDDRGRLVSSQLRFVDSDALFSDLTVTYNDRARRREWRVVVDISSLTPQAGGPGLNRGYELFDSHGALIERSWTKPDGERSVEHYRYDREGRQTLKAFEGPGKTSYTAREVYRCP